MKKQARLAVYRRNGKLFGYFTSIEEAARVLNIPKRDILRVLSGKTKTAWCFEDTPQRALGSLVFREIVDATTH